MASKVGKLPVAIPAGVTVTVGDNLVTVKGAKGELKQAISNLVKVEVKGAEVVVTPSDETKAASAAHGLYRNLIHNMVTGVSAGFTRALLINGVGYRAAKQGKKLNLTLGYSHPVEMEDPEGIETIVEGTNVIRVVGIDKEKVGQFAAEIRFKRPPEPYKGKGIKYADEVIRRKEGKTGK